MTREDFVGAGVPVRWNTFNEFKGFCLKDGSSQGHNLAVTVLLVLNSIDSGARTRGKLLPEVSFYPR